MINGKEFKELIIKPALFDLLMYSEAAVQLLLFTCANESDGVSFLKQVKGNALGVYQMQPETYNDIWINYIAFRSSLSLILTCRFDCPKMPLEDRLIYDLRFATVMTRIHYERVQEPIPNDINGIWEYYKKYYNTIAGKADKETAIRKYNFFRISD